MKAIVTYKPYSITIENIKLPLVDDKYIFFSFIENITEVEGQDPVVVNELKIDYFDGIEEVELLSSNLEDSKSLLRILQDSVRELAKKQQ